MTLHIKVRLAGERRFRFVTHSGSITVKRLHAGAWTDQATARTVADDLVASNEQVVAASVNRDGRAIYRVGEPTPSAPVYGTTGGYKHLTHITATGRPVFEIKDADGRWGIFDENAYEECVADAERAGVPSRRITVYGRIALLATEGVRFQQVGR